MQIMREIRGKLYISLRLVLNDPKNIYTVELDKKKKASVPAAEENYIMIMDSFPEMVEHLRYSYSAFIRLGDDWKRQDRIVWINHDADFRTFNRRFNGTLCYLGRWDRVDWPLLENELKMNSARTYIVRNKWFKEMQELLLDNNIGIPETELERYIGSKWEKSG